MGIFDRLRDTEPANRPKPRRPLTAAGARIDLAHPDPIMVRRHEWQTAAWGYRDVVPEMRFAMDFVSDALSRIRIYAAENRPKGEDPIPLDSGDSSISERTRLIAKDAIERIDLDKHGSTIMGRGGENIDTAGECFILGRVTPDGGEDWSIRSVTEVSVQGSQITLTEPGRSSGGEVLDPDTTELIRLWKPHPQYYDWPDAGMAAALEYAEELKLYSRLIRTSVRSRLSSGALFYLPNEFSLTRPGGAPTSADPTAGEADEDDDLFMDEFVTGLITPISDESDPSAVVPMVIRGPAMIDQKPAKDLMGVVELPRQDPEKLAAQREAATRAFARGIKLPPEILMGLGETNHWSGWVIDSTTCKNYIEPRAEVLCDSLTAGYLRPFLRAAGCPDDEIRKVVLWYDPRELVENPNRAADAKDGHTAGVLSDAAYARALGFGPEDMPDLPEKVYRALSGRAISDQQVPLILASLGVPRNDPLMVAAVAAAKAGVPQKAPAGGPSPRVINAPAAEPPAGQDNPVPSNPLPKTASAGAPSRPPMLRVDERLCRALGDVDRQLTERLLAHCEATVGRAVEKAATRIKARAQREPELAAAFRGQDQVAVVARYGRARLGEFAADDDVTDAIDQLRPRFVQAIADGAEMTADIVGELLGREPSRELAQKLTAGGDRAWPWLVQRLIDLADAVLFDDKIPTVKGEKNPGAVPVSLVRGALTIAGGLPQGSEGVNDDGLIRSASGARPLAGLTGGEAVTEEMHDGGGVELGFEWNYYGVPRDPFHPHRELSGVRFMGFDDPKLETRPQDLGWIGSHYVAGDHKGCLCSNLAIWAVPRDPMEARNLADIAMTVESPRYRRDREILLEGPDGDDANPGRGTLPGGRTYAQAARDLREELAALRTKHILDRGAEGPITAAWNPARHPRDHRGRFIRVGAPVSLPDGRRGEVVNDDLGDGKVRVRTADGDEVDIEGDQVTVDPDGGMISAMRAGDSGALREALDSYRRDAFVPRDLADAEDWARSLSPRADELGPATTSAIRDYSASSADRLNGRLRKGGLTPYDQEQVELLEGAAVPLPRPVLLRRSIPGHVFDLNDADVDGSMSILGEMVGKVITDRGFGSTSVGEPDKAHQYSVLLMVVAPAGAPVIPVARHSIKPYEREVTLLPGHRIGVQRVSRNEEMGRFEVEGALLPDGERPPGPVRAAGEPAEKDDTTPGSIGDRMADAQYEVVGEVDVLDDWEI